MILNWKAASAPAGISIPLILGPSIEIPLIRSVVSTPLRDWSLIMWALGVQHQFHNSRLAGVLPSERGHKLGIAVLAQINVPVV